MKTVVSLPITMATAMTAIRNMTIITGTAMTIMTSADTTMATAMTTTMTTAIKYSGGSHRQHTVETGQMKQGVFL